MSTFGRYTFTANTDIQIPNDNDFINPGRIRNQFEVYSFKDADYVQKRLLESGIQVQNFTQQPMSLEDAFIGLTGKY
jgi:ABC-2 type transport system ATP-binding protein